MKDWNLYIIIIILKPNIPRPPLITRHKLLIPRGPFILGIRRQHALDAHADTLDRLHGRPAGTAEQVETDDAVAVDVRVDGDREGGCFWGGVCWEGVGCELDFGGFCFTTTNGLVGYLFWYIYLIWYMRLFYYGYMVMGEGEEVTDGIFRTKGEFQTIGLVAV